MTIGDLVYPDIKSKMSQKPSDIAIMTITIHKILKTENSIKVKSDGLMAKKKMSFKVIVIILWCVAACAKL